MENGAGTENTGWKPSMVLKAESYASTQVRSIQQSKEDFLNILKSFRLKTSKWSGGFVKYAKSNEPISIVLTDSENEILDPDAPWQHTRTLSEVVNGKVTGSYELMTQGSQIVSMSYTKQSNGKVYSFGFNTSIDSSLESGCKWE